MSFIDEHRHSMAPPSTERFSWQTKAGFELLRAVDQFIEYTLGHPGRFHMEIAVSECLEPALAKYKAESGE